MQLLDRRKIRSGGAARFLLLMSCSFPTVSQANFADFFYNIYKNNSAPGPRGRASAKIDLRMRKRRVPVKFTPEYRHWDAYFLRSVESAWDYAKSVNVDHLGEDGYTLGYPDMLRALIAAKKIPPELPLPPEARPSSADKKQKTAETLVVNTVPIPFCIGEKCLHVVNGVTLQCYITRIDKVAFSTGGLSVRIEYFAKKHPITKETIHGGWVDASTLRPITADGLGISSEVIAEIKASVDRINRPPPPPPSIPPPPPPEEMPPPKPIPVGSRKSHRAASKKAVSMLKTKQPDHHILVDEVEPEENEESIAMKKNIVATMLGRTSTHRLRKHYRLDAVMSRDFFLRTFRGCKYNGCLDKSTLKVSSTHPADLPFENEFIEGIPWYIRPIDSTDGIAIISRVEVKHTTRQKAVFFQRKQLSEMLSIKWQRLRLNLSSSARTHPHLDKVRDQLNDAERAEVHRAGDYSDVSDVEVEAITL